MEDVEQELSMEEDLPDVRAALQRAFQRAPEPEELISRMDEIREITFFEDYLSMKVMTGSLLERLKDDDGLRSDVELSLSAAFGRPMQLKVHRYT